MGNSMLNAEQKVNDAHDAPAASPPCRLARPRVALLSNPRSTGNIAQLERIRDYCADHPDIFHYEVENVAQIGDAMKSIARVRPKMLVINGGDGTVQACLTEIHNGGHFDNTPPPMAVLPSGKTNLIALDLGMRGDPIETIRRLVEIAQGDLGNHLVARELIALRKDGSERPVIGMFLGGAGLADTMLYCRDKIYPLGLPNAISHALTATAVLLQLLFGMRASFLPPKPAPLRVSTGRAISLTGRYTLLIVTTLEKLLLSNHLGGEGRGRLKVVAIEERPSSVIRALFAGMTGGYRGQKMRGIHFEEADEITIEGERSNVILDGETFSAERGSPIRLKPAQPLSFVRLAA
ncbi:MAG TPA: diacylglycerol kinase family protein [Sphingomicrobium sp.]|nr:diacylglycerol kinase family protein [Sphingomicrobium sp.]